MNDWLCVSDSDVPVVYGDSFPMTGDFADTNAIGHLKYVLNDVDDIRRSYVRLGFHLSEIQRLGMYTSFGYDNMKDFCINNVPVDYSILSRCISVYERFCAHGATGTCLNRLDPCYDGFSFSQLVELMGLTHLGDDLPRLKKYSVAKLRDLKKFCLSKYGKWGYCSAYLDEYEASLLCADVDGNCDVATENDKKNNIDFKALDSLISHVPADNAESGNCDVAIEKDKSDELDAAVLDRLLKLKGAPLYSFVRGFPAFQKFNVTLYSNDGRKLFTAADYSVIYFDGETLHIRADELPEEQNGG